MRSIAIKRALRVSAGAWIAASLCVAVGLGLTTTEHGTPSPLAVLLFAAIAVAVLIAVIRRLQFRAPSARAQRVSRAMALAPFFSDAEIALAMVAGLYAAIGATGGLHSPLYPLVYAVAAFSATFQTRAAAIVTLAAIVGLESARLWIGADSVSGSAVLFHIGFAVGFACLHLLFLRGLVRRLREDHRERVAEAVRAQTESARDYRLIASPLGAESRAPRSRRDEEAMLASGAAATVASHVYYTLRLLKRSLGAQSAVLLWLDERSERLKVKEMVSDSDEVTEDPSVPLAGVLGAIVRDRSLLSLPQTRPGHVPYYERSAAVGAFLGAPVIDGGHLRGVLCVDRDEAFDERDAALVVGAAEQVVHAIKTEQVFTAVERAKYEHERFYHASAMLCQALTLEQVMDTAFDAAGAIVDYDLAVITLYDRARKRHRIYATRGSDAAASILAPESLSGLEFRDNAGLASMVVKNKHYLPAAGALRDETTPVFTRKYRFKNAESLLVLPLLSADEAVGTFTLVSRRRAQFRKDTREMLGVIANQVAISLQNALMYKRMETMATTDGLTGLTNHRAFQERFADLLERAERHGHKAAMLLCDVDHFKSVNDTYGHPVGDEVLRQVARVLQNATRKIDIPARYGGEEFAVVLEATDLEGAIGLAERIRMDVGKLEIESDKGTFGVTMSIGVSAFPDDSRVQADLIERADMALYHAKQSGRNRVVSFRDFDAARRSKRAS